MQSMVEGQATSAALVAAPLHRRYATVPLPIFDGED
jgi:2-methylcitrate dehydratase PrpD